MKLKDPRCRIHIAKVMVPRCMEVRRSLPHTDAGKVEKKFFRGIGPVSIT
jgi:hypothetical protein